MSKKWRYLCTVHGWQYTWSDNQPTECSIESSDPLDPDQFYIIGKEIPVMTITPRNETISSSNFKRMVSIIYDADCSGPLHRVKLLGAMDNQNTSYEIEIYDRDTHTSLLSTSFSNTGDVQLVDMGLLPTPIESGMVNIEINGKKSGGNRRKVSRVEQIIFYSRKE